MKIGDTVYTPRFCTVKIQEVFETEQDAKINGYTEPTHYKYQHSDGYDILGKHTGLNRMNFAAVKLA